MSERCKSAGPGAPAAAAAATLHAITADGNGASIFPAVVKGDNVIPDHGLRQEEMGFLNLLRVLRSGVADPHLGLKELNRPGQYEWGFFSELAQTMMVECSWELNRENQARAVLRNLNGRERLDVIEGIRSSDGLLERLRRATQPGQARLRQ